MNFSGNELIKPSLHSNTRQRSGSRCVLFLTQCVKVEQLALVQHRTKAHEENLAIIVWVGSDCCGPFKKKVPFVLYVANEAIFPPLLKLLRVISVIEGGPSGQQDKHQRQ